MTLSRFKDSEGRLCDTSYGNFGLYKPYFLRCLWHAWRNINIFILLHLHFAKYVRFITKHCVRDVSRRVIWFENLYLLFCQKLVCLPCSVMIVTLLHNCCRVEATDYLSLQFLGCIGVLRTYMWRIVTDGIVWSVGLSVSLSVCLSWSWALQKRLNWSRRHLGCGLRWAQGTMY